MRIAILGFAKVKYMPYLHFYLNQLDLQKHDVHLLYWKRDKDPDVPLPKGVTGYVFDCPIVDTMPIRTKLPKFLRYGNFAKRTLKRIQPDFLIVMLATTAITIYPLLMGKYRNRYILDYRDVTYEGNRIYQSAVANIIKNSVLSFTSSDGFRKYLPETEKLLTSHNLMKDLLARKVSDAKPFHTPIRVSFWGLLRHKKVNQLLIDRLAGDNRFELHYYGRAQGSMLTMVQEAERQYNNVFYHGEYRPSEIPDLAAKTDLLHNIYDTGDRTMPVAMSNKYYEGILFKIPLLCSNGSLMGKMSQEKGVGLACDPNTEDFANKLYSYYVNLDNKRFSENCDQELERILIEMESGNQAVQKALHNI